MPLTEIQLKHGPFARDVRHLNWPGRDYVVTCDSLDRIREVNQSDDPEWLQAVLAEDGMQKTVRLAAERRLRKLTQPKPKWSEQKY